MGGYVGPPPGSTAEQLMDTLMPTGFIWVSTSSDDPNALFPGTWVDRGTDTFAGQTVNIWERTA